MKTPLQMIAAAFVILSVSAAAVSADEGGLLTQKVTFDADTIPSPIIFLPN
ncbi:MAG: hypothetical protein AAF826_12090 [Pseudomonadota bacterium]